MRRGWKPGLLAVAALAWPAGGHTHSWYPWECCDDGDCHPADTVTLTTGGRLVATVGTARVLVPADLPARPSPDGRIHVCYENGDLGIRVRCVFLPPGS